MLNNVINFKNFYEECTLKKKSQKYALFFLYLRPFSPLRYKTKLNIYFFLSTVQLINIHLKYYNLKSFIAFDYL